METSSIVKGEFIPKKRGGARPGAGRRAGVPNTYTSELREMIWQALDMNGGAEYLARQAQENPGPFTTLLGKTLPPNWVAYDPAQTSGTLTIKWES